MALAKIYIVKNVVQKYTLLRMLYKNTLKNIEKSLRHVAMVEK